jgi:tetratricopeptide (TPR) repeat protein
MGEFLARMVLAAAAPGVDGKTVLAVEVLRMGEGDIKAPLYKNYPETAAWVKNILGNCYLGLGLLDKAQEYLEQALEERVTKLGPEHPDTLGSKHDMARLLQRQRKLAEAEALMRETLAARQRILKPGDFKIVESMGGLADLLAERKQWSEAIDRYRDAAELCRESRPQFAALLQFRGGQCLRQMDKAEEAEREMLAGYRGMCATYGDGHDYTRDARRELRAFYIGLGQPEEARKYSDAVLTLPATGVSPPKGAPAATATRTSLDRHEER